MKKVAVFLADGFEDVEALATVDVLRRAKIQCDMVSIKDEKVRSAYNVEVKADKILGDDIEEYDMVVCPGGLPGAEYLSKNEKVLDVIRKFAQNEINILLQYVLLQQWFCLLRELKKIDI